MLAPPRTKGEHRTGWLRRLKARIADSIVSSQTSGELPLQLPTTTECVSMNASPNRMAHMSSTSSALRPEVVIPMKVLSE